MARRSNRHLHRSHHLVAECAVKEYINVGEDSEMEICGYHDNRMKQLVCWVVTVMSAGLLRLVFYWYPKWMLLCMCSRCNLATANYVLLKDQYNQLFVETVRIMSTDGVRQKCPNIWSIDFLVKQHSSDVTDASIVRYFTNKKLKYIWQPDAGSFEQLKGLEEGYSCSFFHNTIGLSANDKRQRCLLYGNNEIIVSVTPVIKLLFTQVLNPFYMFQVFSVILWFFDEYYYYAACIVLITLISLSAEVVETRTMQRALKGTICGSEIVSVQRNGQDYVDMLSDQLVPGDVIEVPRQGCVMSCDAVLISGNCIVNESMLTGESVPVTKTPIPHPGHPDSGQMLFSITEHSRHTLFCGTHVIQTRYYGNLKVRAVVLRTGFMTTKGELVRSILYPKPVDFKFTQDAFKFIGILAGIACIGMIYTLVLMMQRGDNAKLIILRTLDLITIVVPPALPAAVTAGTVFAQKRLRKQRVYCISPNSINLCGAINVFCFDKTGTLTEDGLDMWGCIPSYRGSFQLELHDVWKLGRDNLAIAMATCHSLTVIEGQLVGDPLDLKMFEAVGWELEEPGNDTNKYDVFMTTVVRPTKPDFVPAAEDFHHLEDIPFEIGIVRQFPFSSKLQRMSVITRTLTDDHFELYVKGSPEMIVSLCSQDSVPDDFPEVLLSYTLHGYRVIALAMRNLHKMTYVKVQRAQRELMECNLTFLGLLVMENRLKPQTTPIIQQLKAASIRPVMVTGDNILTALSVARECQMITPNDSAVLVHVLPSSGEGGEPAIRWTYAEETHRGQTIENHMDDETVQIEMNEKVHFALTGKSWALIREHFPQLINKLVVKGTVFARMSPEQKQQLIETLQQVGYHVGMCGDGANDCGALKTAHAGISLSEAEASVASPFTSKVQDISCVPTVIREGRASLVTSFGIFKYMACYSLTQFTSVCLLYWIGANLTDLTFLYIDLFLLTSLSISFGYTSAYSDLVPEVPVISLISLSPVVSIITQMMIMISIQVVAWVYVRSQPWFLPYVHNDEEDYASHEVTTVFCVSAFQYITLAVVFSKGAPFRKSIFTNYLFLVNLVILVLATVYITVYPFAWLQHLLEMVLPPSMFFRCQIVGIAAINFLLCYILELFVVSGFTRLSSRLIHHLPACLHRKNTMSCLEQIEQQLLASPVLPPTSRSTSSFAEMMRYDTAVATPSSATPERRLRRNSIVSSVDELRSAGLIREDGILDKGIDNAVTVDVTTPL